MLDGTVKSWSKHEGWGVLVPPDVPGEVWTHFSSIVAAGYRCLTEGELVRFDCEHVPTGQDGYLWRAKRVVSVDEGSEFARLTDQEIDERIKAVDRVAHLQARTRGPYLVTERVIRINSPRTDPDPSPPG
jgi:cold shock CspA family protein